MQKASAWYLVTYDRSYSTKKETESIEVAEMLEIKKTLEAISKDILSNEQLSLGGSGGKDKSNITSRAKIQAGDDFLISFPWVVHEILCDIKKEKNKKQIMKSLFNKRQQTGIQNGVQMWICFKSECGKTRAFLHGPQP